MTPWWDRDRHADRRPRLMLRNGIVAAFRAWFSAREFVEIDPAALQLSPGNEVHLHAFSTALAGPDGASRPVHLHTSPEFALKKLLAAGERRLFSLSHVFRNRERGALHHPEFTMLEWYRAGEDYDAAMADCTALLRLAAGVAGRGALTFRGRNCVADAKPERLNVAAAFHRHAGIDLAASLSPDGAGDAATLAGQCRTAGIRIAPDDTWSDMFARVLVERIEPHLGISRPTLLDRYPAAESALARRTPGDPRFAERFELYVCGVELANGFGEQTDAREQRRRLRADMDERERRYGERYPLDEDFLAALAQMPQASGVALGLDRLVMLAAGAERVEDVIWTPVAEPDIARR